MEGDISRSHMITGVRKVYTVAFTCPRVANKYASESASGKLGQGRRVILDKGCTSIYSRRKGEEGRGREEMVKGNSTTKGSRRGVDFGDMWQS